MILVTRPSSVQENEAATSFPRERSSQTPFSPQFIIPIGKMLRNLSNQEMATIRPSSLQELYAGQTVYNHQCIIEKGDETLDRTHLIDLSLYITGGFSNNSTFMDNDEMIFEPTEMCTASGLECLSPKLWIHKFQKKSRRKSCGL